MVHIVHVLQPRSEEGKMYHVKGVIYLYMCWWQAPPEILLPLHQQLLLFLLTVYRDYSIISRSTERLNTATAAVFAQQRVHPGRDENMHYGLANAIDRTWQC